MHMPEEHTPDEHARREPIEHEDPDDSAENGHAMQHVDAAAVENSHADSPTVHAPIRPGVDLLEMYLRVRHESENTRRAYRYDIEEFFGAPEVIPELAARARFTHVRAHLEDLKRRGLKASTVRRKISAVRSFFRWLLAVSEAEGLELIEYNPARTSGSKSPRTWSRQSSGCAATTDGPMRGRCGGRFRTVTAGRASRRRPST